MQTYREIVAQQYGDSANLRARARLHQRFSTNKQGWLPWVFERIRCPVDGRILELGCGMGGLWLENRQQIRKGWRLMLTDLSRGMVRDARAALAELGRPIHLGIVDAQCLPFARESVDVVIANHMLYHVPDRDRCFTEIRRVLREGSALYTATNGRAVGLGIRDWVNKARPDRPVDRSLSGMAFDFSLETGKSQLTPFFEAVELHRYRDSLSVTDVEALVEYVQSTVSMQLEEDELAAFRRILADEISRHGAVHVAKCAGLFEARKG